MVLYCEKNKIYKNTFEQNVVLLSTPPNSLLIFLANNSLHLKQ